MNLYETNETEYECKRKEGMIEGEEYLRYYSINKNLKKKLTTIYDSPNRNSISNDKHKNPRDIYDHMHSFRIKNPRGLPRKTINVTFAFPYNKVSKLPEYLNEPWLDEDYKIYIVNPRLFRYYQEDTIGLAHVKDQDFEYGEGTTERVLSFINSMMINETGESLFYKIE